MECDHAVLSKTSKTGSSLLLFLYGTINYMTGFMSSAHFSFYHRDQDLKNLEIQRITEKAEAQINISALEQEVQQQP